MSLLTPEQRERLDKQVAKIKREKEVTLAAIMEQFADIEVKDLTTYEAIALNAAMKIIESLDPCQLKAWFTLSEKKTIGFISGRRVGKSYLATALTCIRMLMHPNTNCLIVAPTISDAEKIHMEGERPGTGMLQLIPSSLIQRSTKGNAPYVKLTNGSRCDFMGATNPEKGRGHGYRFIVFDEANFYKSWNFVNSLLFAVTAIEEDQRMREVMFTTTPSFSAIYVKLMETCGENIIRVPTWEAIHRYAADEAWLRDVYFLKENTLIGRQELFAEIPQAADYACFTPEQYRKAVQPENVPKREDFEDVIVSIDHSITEKAVGTRSETGIVVLGKHKRPEASVPDIWVLDENSIESGNPDLWVKNAMVMVDRYSASRYLVEDNQGGLLIQHAIRTKDKHTPIATEHAVIGKEQRSMEARSIMDEGRVFFAKELPALASQCITFAPKSAPEMKFDRADAYIQGVRRLIGKQQRGSIMFSA